jgi:hypothetical protein
MLSGGSDGAAELVRSILDQPLPGDLEFTFVCQQGQDVDDSLAERGQIVEVPCSETPTAEMCWSTGLGYVTGDYVAVLDDYSTVPNLALMVACNIMERHENVGLLTLAHGPLVGVPDTVRYWFPRETPRAIFFPHPVGHYYVASRLALEAVDGYDVGYEVAFADLDLCFKVRQEFEISSLPHAQYFVRVSKEPWPTDSEWRFSKAYSRDEQRFLERWADWNNDWDGLVQP